MKIISKYKDYYDYLNGVYGIDPLIVLDRRDFDIPKFFSNEVKKIILFIAGIEIQGLYHKGNFYFGENIAQFNVEFKVNNRWWRRWENKDREKEVYYNVIDPNDINNKLLTIYPTPKESEINEKYNHPILMVNPYTIWNPKNPTENFYKFPKLADMNVQSILEPEKIWLMLTDFLTKKDIIVDNRTNTEKILTAGFDLKESFRGKII